MKRIATCAVLFVFVGWYVFNYPNWGVLFLKQLYCLVPDSTPASVCVAAPAPHPSGTSFGVGLGESGCTKFKEQSTARNVQARASTV